MNSLHLQSPLRILHVVGAMNHGGIENWILNVLRGINRNRFKIDLLVHTKEEGAYDKEAKSLGCRILQCPYPRRPWIYAYRFRRLVKEYGPYDIIHSHLFRFTGWIMRLAKKVGIPVRIAHSHNIAEDRTRTILRYGYNSLMKFWLARYSTHYLAVSRDAALALFGPDSLNNSKIHLIPPAIDLAPFRKNWSRHEVKQSLSIPLDVKVVGNVGRFAKQKNHDFFIEVASILCKRRPNIHFLLVGEGSSRSQYMEKVEKMGLTRHFTFTGSRSDVPRLMKGAMDLFLFPSKWEGLGRVLLEAQAAGLTCLVSDIIPKEADVVPALVKRLSLKQPPTVWAEAVLISLDNPPPVRPREALTFLEQSPFSINVNIKTLESFYLKALTECK